MNSIPKIIHYCWFGGKDKSADILGFIDGWKKIHPDFEFREWNESNFDLDLYPYAKEAHEVGRFAFVTDVVRLHALYYFGGIYMDTDVELLKPFNEYLSHEAFTGCETSAMCVTGTIGAKAGNHWIGELLSEYNGRHFKTSDGALDLTTNTTSITKITKKYFGWVESDSIQDLGLVTIYSSEFFCAKSYKTGIISITDNTCTVHHFKGSWKNSNEKRKSSFLNKSKSILVAIFGEKFFNKINSFVRKKKSV